MAEKRKISGGAGTRFAAALIGGFMIVVSWAAAVYFSAASAEGYTVWGVDISNYQGDVDWQSLESQGVRFAFVKATEGSGHTDDSVRRNLERAAECGVLVSCYHFFSFDSAGETQAQNFINAVGKDEIQLYADKSLNKPSRSETEQILTPLLEGLEEYYGVKPIIYTTIPVYLRYVREGYSDYPLWIRCTRFEPDLIDWEFWQYSDEGELEGYIGEEKYIDLNVWHGTEAEFEQRYGI